jgi:hypothetical protein
VGIGFKVLIIIIKPLEGMAVNGSNLPRIWQLATTSLNSRMAGRKNHCY